MVTLPGHPYVGNYMAMAVRGNATLYSLGARSGSVCGSGLDHADLTFYV